MNLTGKTLAAITLLLTLTPPLGAGVGQWSHFGPYGLDIEALYMDPANPSNLIAAVAIPDKRLFRSSDGGATWSRVPLIIPNFTASVAAGPSAFYLSLSRVTGTEPLLRRSDDGGETWTSVPGQLPRAAFWQVVAADPPYLYSKTHTSGVYRSTDSGATWTAVNDGLDGHLVVDKLVMSGGDSSVLLVASSRTVDHESPSALFRSTDGGETWDEISDTLPPAVVARRHAFRALAVDPADPSNIYAAFYNAGTNWRSAVYRSTDGGGSWEVLPGAGDPEGVVKVLAVAPAGGPTVFLADSAGLWVSSGGGGSWTKVLDLWVDGRVDSVVIDPQVPTTVYAAIQVRTGFGTIPGVLRSTDGGSTWEWRRHGLGPMAIEDVAVDPRNPDRIFAVSKTRVNNLVLRSDDRGATWESALAYLSRNEQLVIDPEDSSIIYCLTGWRTEGILRSDDGGETWATSSPGQGTEPRVLAIDPVDPSFVYAGLLTGLSRSQDRGLTWQELDVDISSVRSLAVDPETRDLYAGTSDGTVHFSRDRGATWVQLGDPMPGGRIESLAVDPRRPVTLYAGTSTAGVYRYGEDVVWRRSLAADVKVREVAVDPDRPSVVYAGTRLGVHRSVDGGGSWEMLEPESFGSRQVTSLSFDPADPGVLWAGTHRGVAGIDVVESTDVLSLRDGRFEVEIEWQDFQGAEGPGTVAVVPAETRAETDLRSRDSAALEFFGGENWEMLLKVLDGTAINDRFWVFFAAATDVGYTVTVTDTSCGETKSYINPVGLAARSVTDAEAFVPCESPAPPSCVADEDTLCLGEGGRFRLEVVWTNFAGASGAARQVRLAEAGLAASGDSGLFYFFVEDNWELLVKVLDGCSINNHFWIFGAATTDVGYRLKVTDTVTGTARTWVNPVGLAAPAITDTRAFPNCHLD